MQTKTKTTFILKTDFGNMGKCIPALGIYFIHITTNSLIIQWLFPNMVAADMQTHIINYDRFPTINGLEYERQILGEQYANHR